MDQLPIVDGIAVPAAGSESPSPQREQSRRALLLDLPALDGRMGKPFAGGATTETTFRLEAPLTDPQRVRKNYYES
jgi:hypothetical protein